MDPLEKEARIRLYMEKIKKEEEEAKKIRLSQEKKFLEDEKKKEIEREIFQTSKNRIVLDKIKECLRTNDWIGVIEQLNECLFEYGNKKRLLDTRDNYSKMNKRVGDLINEDIANPYDFKDKKEYIGKITCGEYGINGGYVEKEKYSYNYETNRLSTLKSFNESIEMYGNFRNFSFFYHDVFIFVRSHIIEILKKYDPSGYYSL